MKILKLAILVIVVLGVVVGAFFLTSPSADIPADSVVSHEAQGRSDRIKKDFSETAAWSQEAYVRQANEIDQDEASGNISGTDRRLLHDQLNNAAINQLYAQMTGEFSKPSCSNAVITELYSGVKALQAKVPADQRLATLEQCYGKYEAIRRFVAGPVSFPIGFNGTSWKSLSEHQSAFRQKLNGYRNDALYKQYLSNITELKSGLSGMEAKAAKEAAGYYRRLADQIYSHYCESADSEYDKSNFSAVLRRYAGEAGQGQDYSKLYTLYIRKY